MRKRWPLVTLGLGCTDEAAGGQRVASEQVEHDREAGIEDADSFGGTLVGLEVVFGLRVLLITVLLEVELEHVDVVLILLDLDNVVPALLRLKGTDKPLK